MMPFTQWILRGTLLWSLWFGSYSLQGQDDLQVDQITTEDGLSQGVVFDILQDKEGFLWIATKDGLNRYDGNQFEIFTNDPDDPWSLSGNSVNHLFEDSSGRIWACSSNEGINIYDKKTGKFHHIKHNPHNPGSLSGNYIRSIVEDTSGYFIVSVAEQEINMFLLHEDFFSKNKAPQIIRVPVPDEKSQDEKTLAARVVGLVKDSKNRIWVGGINRIYQLDVKRAKLETAFEGSTLGTGFGTTNGEIWSSDGEENLINWDGKIPRKLLRNFMPALDIQIGEDGKMWCLNAGGLYGVDLNKWKAAKDKISVNDPFFYKWYSPSKRFNEFPFLSMTIDRSGIIWIGTNGYGLYKFNPNKRKFSHLLPGKSIRQILVNSLDSIFCLDYNDAWVFIKENKIQSLPAWFDREKEDVDFLLKSKNGTYWLRKPTKEATGSVLINYDPKTGKKKSYEISWHHYDFQPMIECKDGTIMMAGFDDVLTIVDPTSGQLINFDVKNGIRIEKLTDENNLLSYNYSTALYEASDGNFWVGTERGFSKLIPTNNPENPFQITHFEKDPNDKNSIRYNHVSCFLEDPIRPEKYLWICTRGGGISRFDKINGNFLNFTSKEGLPNNVVYGLLSDKKGNLWGSSNKGIFCLIPEFENADSFLIRNFTKADGLQSNEFNTGSFTKFKDSKLAFGGINGINIFDPEEILAIHSNPTSFITKLLVNNIAIHPGDESGILTKAIEYTDKITLQPKDDIVTLEFVSLDFNAPEQIKYRYQLDGAGDAWIEAGNNRSATFLHLPPGDYTFRVQGSNSQGLWGDKMAELKIEVLPPWWKTSWAYLSYLLLIILAAVSYFRFTVNRSKLNQQLIFEKREAERIRELDAMKTQLYTNMTHEFRTPLTVILGMANQVKENPKAHYQEGLDLIIRNGQNLLTLVNKMLNLSKLESGKMSLELKQGDVVDFLKNLVSTFKALAFSKEIHLHFLPEVDSLVMDFDNDKLQQVVSNLISNAFKFTPEGGHIYFSIRKEDSNLLIRVKDTGHGIPKSDLENIFDRFFQVDNSNTRAFDGSGIGLALAKELVNLMNGEISAQSPPPGAKNGSEFIVSIPILNQVVNMNTSPAVNKIDSVRSDEKMDSVAVGQRVPKTLKIELDSTDSGRSDNPLILIVEDNEDVASYIASCLIDYQLVIAQNGQEGLEIAFEVIPDLVISDIMMPVMDGFEFSKKLKADKRTSHIPIIMLTAKADMDSKIEGLELGASAYLRKPYEKKELLLNIKNLFAYRETLRAYYQNVAGLVEETSDQGEQVPDLHLPEDDFVAKVRTYIEEHISEFDLSVDQLAKNHHLSHSQFGRKLDALTGFSPNRFIRYLRLKKSKELLKNQDLSITVVAYDCGFNDPGYFARVFKKEFKMTPMEWRNTLVEK